MMVDTKESKVMDIKINDIQTSSSVQQVKNTESTDSSFKFTLISNIAVSYTHLDVYKRQFQG